MNKKNILIYMIIVILIIIVLISCILISLKNNTQPPIDIQVDASKIEEKEVTDNSKFYTVSDCVSKYLSELNKNNSKYYGTAEDGEYKKVVEEQDIKQNIYALLSEEYIKRNNITISNVYDYVYDITKQVIFVPIEMKYISLNTIEKYVVHGFILNEENELIKEIYIGVNLQPNDKLFSIEQYKNEYTSINDIQIVAEETAIKSADNNSFKYVNPTTEYIIKQYLNMYKRLIVAKPEMTYNMLDEQYRKNKFANFEEYKKYIEKNSSKIKTATLSKYQTTNRGNYTQYTCLTQTGDYYIFKQTGVMQFSLILDTYTIDLPEYIEKYNKSSNEQKVALCIDKFMKNINAENYTLAYSMLSSGFKNNYFKTLSSFENYAKQYLFGKEVAYKQIQSEAEVYIYEVTLSGEERNFNVKLGKGTNFELSFNVN